MGPELIDRHRDDLADLIAAKGTFHFTPENPIPDASIVTLVNERMALIAEGQDVERLDPFLYRFHRRHERLPFFETRPGGHRVTRPAGRCGERPEGGRAGKTRSPDQLDADRFAIVDRSTTERT